MKTIVTGGTGFVGSNIVKALAQRGHQVVSIDIVGPDGLVRQYLEPWSDQIAWVQADILDSDELDKLTSNLDIGKIVHAAVYTVVREETEREDSRRIIDINLVGTANMLELARQLVVERFLYVSSGGVYEGVISSDERIKEDVPVHPSQLYNVTKYASELLTKRYGWLHGFETVSVRLGGPYGPMERVTGHRAVMSLIHEWTGKATRGEPIEAVAQGRMDFTYVSDIAEGIVTALDSPELSHSVYNLNRGVHVSLDELVSAFRQAYPSVEFVEAASHKSEAAHGRNIMDPSRIRDDLGFTAQYDLVSGLKGYFEWRHQYGYNS